MQGVKHGLICLDIDRFNEVNIIIIYIRFENHHYSCLLMPDGETIHYTPFNYRLLYNRGVNSLTHSSKNGQKYYIKTVINYEVYIFSFMFHKSQFPEYTVFC